YSLLRLRFRLQYWKGGYAVTSLTIDKVGALHLSMHSDRSLYPPGRLQIGPTGLCMSTPAQIASKAGPWMTMAAVAVVAVVAGLLLPQLMPGEMAGDAGKKIEAALDTKAEYTPPKRPDMPSPQGMVA